MPSQTQLQTYWAAAPYSTSTLSHTGSQTSQGARNYCTGSQVSHTTYSNIPEGNEESTSLPGTKVHAWQGTHGQGGQSMRKLNGNMQEILLYVHAAMLNKMLLNLGWCKGEAVATLGKSHKDSTCTKPMASMIERELITVRGRLIEAAKKFTWKFLQSNNPHKDPLEAYLEWVQAHFKMILNTSDATNFFLHEHDGKASPVPH
ncbi:hypothetical protein PAXRUDRAFT_27194 [Paxillus rubicundulus Ve08.2h10]|uniref:Uncharacterized protein n=1 Tax=Paxillus rubicundulus Ve08.2h10 TaxID=930991 RepID=A0A0D0D3H3_9AGAM|nr:hypothetical protein PAXRUDRAFT_27194 [Paxillus rubicundulus Ve08.2h10]